LAAGRKEFEDAGLIIAGGGTISLQKDDDADMRMYFEYAKAAGMPLMVIAPTKATVPRIEKFVKEYNIKAAIHNHGPEDKHFPSPYDVLEAVQGRDPRMGLCMDVGHTTRTGKDVVKALADAGSRLLDVHIKDLADLMVSGSQCDVGDGVMPVVAIFKQLKKMNFQGYVNLEYEINADAPLVGMQKSFSYMRGVLDALKA
jgi:sugar phosphate isomerase/epimerase